MLKLKDAIISRDYISSYIISEIQFTNILEKPHPQVPAGSVFGQEYFPAINYNTC